MILEGLYKSKLENSVQLQIVMALYDQETARTKEPTYHQLKTAVKTSYRSNNENSKLQVREDVMERGSVTKSQKGNEACVERKVEECLLWKAHGQRSKGDSWTKRTDKHPQRDQAVNRKALWTRVKFHADSISVEIRHVNSGILPCVWITSQEKGCLHGNKCHIRLFKAEGKSNKRSKRGGAQDHLPYWRSLNSWDAYLKTPIQEHLFYVNLENWDRNTPSNSPRAPGTQ